MVPVPGTFEQKARILITDDDPHWRQGLREVLEPRGYQTVEAESGEEAIEVVVRQQPHLIILDIQLPHMNGIETLRIIRQEVGDQLPTIMVSCDVSDQILAQALALHAFTVMSKMVGIHQMLYTIAKVLSKYYRL